MSQRRAARRRQRNRTSRAGSKLGDVAILFRTLSDVQVYEEALREYGLDYYLVGGHAFYAQQEIYDVLNLLRAVASTADEVSLAGVLRSPFFALADETLFWLVDSAGSLNAGLLGRATAAATFAGRARKSRRPPPRRSAICARSKTACRSPRCSTQALDRTGYDAVLLAEFLGERKLANLHKLSSRPARPTKAASSTSTASSRSSPQFIAREPKESLAATLPEAANVIRLMTIHHAKGLEFPLVIVPDLDRPPLLRPPIAALDPELGPLVPRPPTTTRKNRHRHEPVRRPRTARRARRTQTACCTSPARARPTT